MTDKIAFTYILPKWCGPPFPGLVTGSSCISLIFNYTAMHREQKEIHREKAIRKLLILPIPLGLYFDTFAKKATLTRKTCLIATVLLMSAAASGQKDTVTTQRDTLPDGQYIIREVEREGVRLPEVEIREVQIHARPTREQRREFRQYERLVANIKKVYPYALIVRSKLSEVNEELKSIPEQDRKKYLRNVEKDVFKQYQGDIENMTITQGKILIKLIDRETQNTSYELIRDYRGKFSAAFWQSIARIFGTNLKTEYDPYGEDAIIEMIINEIDAGRL